MAIKSGHPKTEAKIYMRFYDSYSVTGGNQRLVKIKETLSEIIKI